MRSLNALFLFILIFLFQNIAEAQIGKERALIGLDSVSVSVSINIRDLELDVLANRLKNSAEIRLRENGITVVSQSLTVIEVDIDGVYAKINDRVMGYAYASSLSLSQAAKITNNGQIMFPYSYQNGTIEIHSQYDIGQEIRIGVESLFDEFINDYLKAN